VLVRPSNDKELAFKLKTAAAPFALIKIGQTTEWLKDFLAGYEIVKGFEDESFFARLNEEDSEINLLMGSRSFYEGWDSNRPNVITFINIGTGSEARKFVLQSVGRGVRIEPMKGKRKRLENLYNAKEVDEMLFGQAKPFLSAVQSLFIFGTKARSACHHLRRSGAGKRKRGRR
jgi:type III restriction enzyme